MPKNYLQELLDFFKNKEKQVTIQTEKEVEKVFDTELEEELKKLETTADNEVKIIETKVEKAFETKVEKAFEKEVKEMLTPQKSLLNRFCIIG